MMPHTCRAVSDIGSTSVLASERRGHDGGELAIEITTRGSAIAERLCCSVR